MTIILAADPSPWYGALEFWASFATVVAILVGCAWRLARWFYYHRAITEREQLRAELRTAREQVSQLKLQDSNDEPLNRKLTAAQREIGQLRQLVEMERARAGEISRELQSIQEDKECLDNNMGVAQQLEGRTWRVKPDASAPKFVPLAERRTPVVAVLNLKGGVGKTTVTANLAAAWARDGWRTLLIDLDLQGSLTSLFVNGEDVQRIAGNQRMVQDYFEQAASRKRPAFLDFVHHCSEHRVEIVGTTDTLAYAELNLTMRWLRWPSRGDVRLLLRDALHQAGHARKYDLVLIDCPPVLNVSCINALAAADYLLIPVMPNKLASDRVRPMIAWVKALRRNMNPDLKIIGVVANRISQSTGLGTVEKNFWVALQDDCKEEWGEDVHMCKTFIPQKVAIRDAENERRPLAADDEAFDCFKKLARELVNRLPSTCRPNRATTTSRAPT